MLNHLTYCLQGLMATKCIIQSQAHAQQQTQPVRPCNDKTGSINKNFLEVGKKAAIARNSSKLDSGNLGGDSSQGNTWVLLSVSKI